MAWTKLPAIEGKHGGCLNCGPRPSFFPPDGVIAVGFGYAALKLVLAPAWAGVSDEDCALEGELFNGGFMPLKK